MPVPLDLYPLSSCRRGALFERNPVCALCYDICMEIGNDSGGINFNLLKALKAADALCSYLVENIASLPEIEHCHHWLETHLQNESAVMCACAAVSVSIAHMEGAPKNLQQLGKQLRGLIYGGANCIYDNLSSAAYQHTASINPSAYGGFLNKPANMEELTPIIKPVRRTTNTPKYPKNMQATQNIQHNAPVFNGPVYNGPVYNGPVYQAPVTQYINSQPSEKVSSSESECPETQQDVNAESILGIPAEKDYKAVRIYIEERSRFDLEFKAFCDANSRVTICQRLSKEFGWIVDPYGLGRNINRKRKKKA